jgi:hypothetical protein
MSFGTDRTGIEKRCYICDSPTRSHPAPNGYVCHTCKTETPEQTLLDALSVSPIPSPTGETLLECRSCGEETPIKHIAEDPSGYIQAGVGFDLFDEYQGMILVSCPACLTVTDYPTTNSAAERIANKLHVPPHEYDPRDGWVKP